jgi:hypothetical protein
VRPFLIGFSGACLVVISGVILHAVPAMALGLALMVFNVLWWWVRLWRSKRAAPPPPRNVHIITSNGARIPLDCVYTGRRHGMHQWAITSIVPDGAMIGVDELPGRTVVVARARRSKR